MDRRTFLSALTGGLLAAPLAAEAQPVAKVPKLGYLTHGSSEGTADSAFMRALRDLGWVDGRTIVIEARYTAGSSELTQEFVREFIARDVDVIVAWSPYAVAAAKRGTRTTPIVGLSMGDPVAAGLVVSLARPGTNVTGLADLQKELHAKRLALLKETVPGIRRVAVLSNPAHPNAVENVEAATQAARSLASTSSYSTSPRRQSWRKLSARSVAGALTVSSCCMTSCSGPAGRTSWGWRRRAACQRSTRNGPTLRWAACYRTRRIWTLWRRTAPRSPTRF